MADRVAVPCTAPLWFPVVMSCLAIVACVLIFVVMVPLVLVAEWWTERSR